GEPSILPPAAFPHGLTGNCYATSSDARPLPLRCSKLFRARPLTLVAQHEAVAADGPAGLLVKEEREEVLARAALLLHPARAAVVGAEDNAGAADRPALLLVDELHAQQRRAHARRHRAPRPAAVVGAQDRAA